MAPMIVADVGGTNARFALATKRDDGQFLIEHLRVLNGSDFPSFSDALEEYIGSLDGAKFQKACVAIAGPIEGGAVRMTNISWEFSRKQMQKAFGFETFLLINDFAAVAIGTSCLTENDLIPLKMGHADSLGNRAVFGPGTGLGVAGLVHSGGRWIPIPSEGGHVNIAPATVYEAEIIRAAIAENGFTSAEALLSGPGFVTLYSAICRVENHEIQDYQPQDITGSALSNDDPVCVTTLKIFCALTGSFAGNLALTYAAKGGVYISGGIIPRFADFLKTSDFVSRFSDKGVMSSYVKDVPVYLIDYDHVAFLGAAVWLAQNA